MPYASYEDYKQWLEDWKLTDKGKAWMERKRQYARAAKERKKQNVTQRKSAKNESVKTAL